MTAGPPSTFAVGRGRPAVCKSVCLLDREREAFLDSLEPMEFP